MGLSNLRGQLYAVGKEVQRMRAKGEAISGIWGFLTDIPLFSNLSEWPLLLLVRACKFKHVEKGKTVEEVCSIPVG